MPRGRAQLLGIGVMQYGNRLRRMARTTLKDIAQAAGCSITTVSHALNRTRYVAAGTRATIEKLAADMGYHPDPVARLLQGQNSCVIGHILSALHDNPFFALVARGADRRAHELGYSTILSYTDRQPEAEERAVRLLLEKRVDGIIFTTPISAANVELCVASGVATVMIERPWPVHGAHAVIVDHHSGVRDLTRLLIDQGHQDLAYIGGDYSLAGSAFVEQQRLRGFHDAIEEASLAVIPSRTFLIPYASDAARTACRSLLDAGPRPDALVIGSDLLAADVLQVLYERGVRIPDDLSIVSVDNTLGPYMAPALTEVEPPAEDMGGRAVELIVRQCQDQDARTHTHSRQRGRRIILEPQLRLRASTRAIPAPAVSIVAS
jgi:LacI family transcriptional regulator